jgi:RHS repeat-associated protein
MLSDGANTFSWNARNQVATLNSVSLQYDGFGRRTKNLQNTTFLFDGANGVQELSGSTATANLISGGIDEIFTRADSTGTYTPLKDALGSTMALVDASGNLVTQYAYDPFGNTTVSGATNSNALQYTGRENEGNGLYFYRARYYSPCTGRFISEDPLGFGGGDENLYGYVFDNPTNLSDPSGMQTGNSGSGNGSGNAPSLAGRYFSPEQCAAIQEILRRERKYGTAIAAIKSGVSSPFSDGLLGVFNSTYVPDFETPLGIMNLDWFTDLEATSLADLGPPFFPYMNIPFIRYGWAKTAWIGIRALHFPDAPPVTNYVPYSSPGETNAAWQATKPWIGYRDIFTPEFVRRKCPPR